MCGIWFSVFKDVPSTVLDVIYHRGPDDGELVKVQSAHGPIYIGHRRLSIIDISHDGHQPMRDAQHSLWITYNGEIYNYLELRRYLESVGHSFKTKTDTEVILKSYIHWGRECLTHFEGMFSFVIYDQVKEEVFAARDPFGIKPLYLYHKSGFLCFASEIKQFKELPDFSSTLHRQRAYDFLRDGLFDHTHDTLFQDVRQIRAGEYCFLRLQDFKKQGDFHISKWYSLPASNTLDISFEKAVHEFRDLFYASVKKHLISDVPVGFCLSGGLDSSSIVCAANSMSSSHNLKTVSACYDDAYYDESKYIEQVSQSTKCAANFVYPSQEQLLKDIRKITWHQDEPFGSMSIFAQWAVFQEAKALGLKVMLDGQGADEQLAGYLFMIPHHIKWLLRKRKYIEFFQILFGFITGDPQFVLQSAGKIFNKNSCDKDALFRKEFFKKNDCELLGQREKQESLKRAQASNDIGALCASYIESHHLPMLLHYEDRNSMAHSIEARVPFLDRKLVELSISLGHLYKYQNGYTKTLLREAMQDILPKAIYRRRSKLGFSVPETSWMRSGLRPYVSTRISKVMEEHPECFDKSALLKYLDSSMGGSKHFDFTLWRIASFGEWSDIFRVNT